MLYVWNNTALAHVLVVCAWLNWVWWSQHMSCSGYDLSCLLTTVSCLLTSVPLLTCLLYAASCCPSIVPPPAVVITFTTSDKRCSLTGQCWCHILTMRSCIVLTGTHHHMCMLRKTSLPIHHSLHIVNIITIPCKPSRVPRTQNQHHASPFIVGNPSCRPNTSISHQWYSQVKLDIN